MLKKLICAIGGVAEALFLIFFIFPICYFTFRHIAKNYDRMIE
jgi:TRAP-type C4-dicarboxylate transport system permease small subunit